MRETVKQMGPSIVSHVSNPCSSCNGQGSKAQDVSRCRVCNDSQMTKERIILCARIESGSPDGSKICFRREGALPSSDAIPGDVIIELKQKDHDRFERKGNDLMLKISLTLSESLCGYRRKVLLLDGRALLLKSQPNVVTKPGSIFITNHFWNREFT